MKIQSDLDERVNALMTQAVKATDTARQLCLLNTIVALSPDMSDTGGARARLLCRIARMLQEHRPDETIIHTALRGARSSTAPVPRAEAIARLARQIQDLEARMSSSSACWTTSGQSPTPIPALALLGALRFFAPFQRVVLFEEVLAWMSPDEQRMWDLHHPSVDTVIRSVIQSIQPPHEHALRQRIRDLQQPMHRLANQSRSSTA